MLRLYRETQASPKPRLVPSYLLGHKEWDRECGSIVHCRKLAMCGAGEYVAKVQSTVCRRGSEVGRQATARQMQGAGGTPLCCTDAEGGHVCLVSRGGELHCDLCSVTRRHQARRVD